MGKRSFSIILALALVVGILTAMPATAQTEGATGGLVPDAPNIIDPAGDANGHSPITGQSVGLTLTGADILTAWFTHDATNLYLHIQTTTGARAEATTFQTDAGTAKGLNCLQFRMTTAGEANDSFSAINVSGDCGSVPTTQFGPLLEEAGPDGTSILTGSYPRGQLADYLGDGKLIAEPDILVGFWGHGNPAAGGSRIGTIEDTDVGTDYTIQSAPQAQPTKPTKPKPPGKEDPPGKGKKKGCGKGKGKQKGACPTPPPAVSACPAYVPGEEGAAAKTSVVTDAATAENPVVVDLTAGPGATSDLSGEDLYDETTSVYQNVQVDSAAASAGLYARVEFPDRHDYDLYLHYADGNRAAASGDFNTAFGTPVFTCGDNCEGGSSFEQINGITTADCAGYTARIASFLTTGGAIKLKLWLGEGTADPAAPGADAGVLATFYSLMGL